MAARLNCLLLALIAALFHQRTEAGHSADTDRVRLAYNVATDRCQRILPNSGAESRSAANESCEQAFKALDDIQRNICRGWRSPACRLINGDDHYQCTCMIAYCDRQTIRTNVVRAFRDCSPSLWSEEYFYGPQVVAPSASFQQIRDQYENSGQAAVLQRSASSSSRYGGAGSSSGAFTPSGTSGSSAFTSVETGSSSGKVASGSGSGSIYRTPITAAPSFASGSGSGSVAATPNPVSFSFLSRSGFGDGSTTPVPSGFSFKSGHGFGSGSGPTTPLPTGLTFAPGTGGVANPAPIDPKRPYPCPYCPKAYNSQVGLNNHLKSHTTNKTICPVCNRNFATVQTMKTHLQNAHPGAPVPPPEPHGKPREPKEPEIGPFKCRECDSEFTHKRGLWDHEKSHTSLDTFCIKCERNFATKGIYKTHVQNQHPDW